MSLFVDFRRFVKKRVKGLCIRRKSLPDGTAGRAYRHKGKWIIEISKCKSEQLQCEYLLHELGHCISGSHWHGKKWALAHEITYNLWMQFMGAAG